jgi:hypothetical protein
LLAQLYCCAALLATEVLPGKCLLVRLDVGDSLQRLGNMMFENRAAILKARSLHDI